MSVMRILWLNNNVLTNEDSRTTGTWLGALAHRLAASQDVQLANIAGASTNEIVRQDCGGIRQWVVPSEARLNKNGLPAENIVRGIVDAVNEFSPDVVHVWGTENYWGLLTARKLIKHPALLETHGLKFAIARVYHGGLSIREQLACIGLKEILRGSTIFHAKRQFTSWGGLEGEIISGHKFITVQTPWLESQIRRYNLSATVFHNEFSIRQPFHDSGTWSYSGNPTIFCTAAYSLPFKGLHVAIRATALLKRLYPTIQLRIAGQHQRFGLRRDGYIAWIQRQVRKLSIEENVTWLGPLSAGEIVAELLGSSAIVIPSFIEGYCLGLAEAMMLGVPAVVAFAGGAASLAQDGVSALYFPTGDEAMCAYQLHRILSDPGLAVRVSQSSRGIALLRNDPGKITNHQLEIYRQVIKESREVKA